MASSRTIPRIVGLFSVGVLLGLTSSSQAHNVADYPANGWKYTILSRVFYQSPNSWPNSYNARTTDAMDKWNAVSSMSLTRSLAGDATSDSWSCGTSYDFLKEVSLGGGAQIADTLVCPAANSTVRIRVNSDYTFYTGSSTPNPNSQEDLQGIMTAELGHAVQAWGACTNGDPADPCPGGHYDPINNGLICDMTDLTSYSTMCNGIATQYTWRWRSLEMHDMDLPQAMY